MATIKSYTNLSQSETLSKILPLESADMWYDNDGESIASRPEVRYGSFVGLASINIPCWSLAALLSILTENKICHYDNRYYCQYMNEDGEFSIYSTAAYDNPVDACVAMVLKLNELKML